MRIIKPPFVLKPVASAVKTAGAKLETGQPPLIPGARNQAAQFAQKAGAAAKNSVFSIEPKTFANTVAEERTAALAASPAADHGAITERFDAMQKSGGLYSPVTGRVAFNGIPSATLKREVASAAVVDRLSADQLKLLVTRLAATGVASDAAEAARAVATWNAVGADVLTHISGITHSEPERASMLRHTNRALMAKVDEAGGPVRHGGKPLADHLGIRLGGLDDRALESVLDVQGAPGAKKAAPLTATAPLTPKANVSQAEAHSYLKSLFAESWKFFEDTVNEATNFLPVDNIKKSGDGFIVDYRTSPTNIGLYMLTTVAAKKLGLITEPEQLTRLHQTTGAIKGLLALNGPLKAGEPSHLFNWYSIDGQPRKLGSFVSSVDNGNLVASLMAVVEEVRVTDPALAKDLEGISSSMSMAVFLDESQGLLRHGAEVKKGVVYNNRGTYNLLMTEARLAVLAGVLKGEIPASTWSNMKPKLGGEFAPGQIELDPEMKFQSWTGTAFESRLPSMFIETKGTPNGASEEQVLQLHLNDSTRNVWGRSEAMADPVHGGTYAAFGSTDAMSKDYAVHTYKANVFAPYASLMFTDLAPAEVVTNMRNFEAVGGRGRYGMYETVAFDAAENPMVTERYYSHHQGMAMLGIVKELGNFVPGLMHNAAANSGRVIEQLLATPVDKYRAPMKVGEAKPVQTVQSAYEGDASYNLSEVIGNGPLIAYVAKPVGQTLWMNPNYALSRNDGFSIRDNVTGRALPFKQEAPVGAPVDAHGARTFEYRVPATGGELGVKVEVSMPTSQTKVSKLTVTNHSKTTQDLGLTGFTRPVLEDPNAVIANAGYRDMFVKTVLHEESGAIVARRRTEPGPKQTSQPYFAFSILGEDGKSIDWAEGSRANFLGREGTAADAAATRAGPTHKGQFGFTQTPFAAMSKSVKIAPGETRELSFVSAYTSDDKQIAALVGRGDGQGAPAGSTVKSAAALQYPPDSTHELMSAFAVDEAYKRAVRPAANIGPKLAPADLGHFINNGRTFRITEPRSLTEPWSAVMGNGLGGDDGTGQPTYGMVATASGGGYSFGGTKAHGTNAQRLRITEWDPDAVTEVPRAGVVIKDKISGASWSIATNPATDPTGKYTVDVSPGSITYRHEGQGMRSQMTKFVAPDDPAEVWQIELQNTGTTARELEVQSFVRFAMGQQYPRTDHLTTAQFDGERAAVFADNPDMLVPGMVAFHSVSGDGSRGTKNDLFNSAEAAVNGLTSVVKVAPGQTKKVTFTLGMAESRDQATTLVDSFGKASNVAAAQKTAESRINALLDTLQIQTPDGELNTMVNSHLPYLATWPHWLMRTGFRQSGGGHGGRDQVQTLRNLLVLGNPKLNAAARKYLMEHASRQFPEGNMNHWWHPHDNLGQNSSISDTALWGPYATLEYVKKTGDMSLLDEQVPYLDGRKLNPGERDYAERIPPTKYTESVYEHGKRAIDLIIDKRMGEHGLPLMLGGDWNDALNKVGPLGKGESGWLAFFLHDNLTQFAAVARERSDLTTATKYEAAAKSLQGNIMKHLWNAEGGYFMRGYADSGEKLDFVDVIVQGWAAESRAVETKFAQQALETAFTKLYNPKTNTIGLLNANFGTETWDGTVANAPSWAGAAAEYPPDVRETGQYTHGVAFAMSGLTKAGMGDLALKAIRTSLPNVHAQREGYGAEPYALAADIQTKTGKAGWTQYSGASGWVLRSATEGLLGLEFRGGNKLFIDPCVPKDWPSFSATHLRGNSKYSIMVTNPSHVSKGIRSVEVDGKPMSLEAYRANGIDIVDDSKPHSINVVMGS